MRGTRYRPKDGFNNRPALGFYCLPQSRAHAHDDGSPRPDSVTLAALLTTISLSRNRRVLGCTLSTLLSTAELHTVRVTGLPGS